MSPDIERMMIIESLVAKGFPQPSEYVMQKAAQLEDRWPPMTMEIRVKMMRALLQEQRELEENDRLRHDDARPVYAIRYPADE